MSKHCSSDSSQRREQKLESLESGWPRGWQRNCRIFSPAEFRRESQVQPRPLDFPPSCLPPICCCKNIFFYKTTLKLHLQLRKNYTSYHIEGVIFSFGLMAAAHVHWYIMDTREHLCCCISFSKLFWCATTLRTRLKTFTTLNGLNILK